MNKLMQKIKLIPKNYFSFADIRKISGLKEQSLKVALSRLAKDGQVTRIGRGFYSLDAAKINWGKIALEIYGPGYVSFESVLADHGILSQKPSNLTIATTKRSRKMETAGLLIFYRHINPELFWGFSNQDGILTATPEKAFLDLAYLSLNGYAHFDVEEMNLDLLDKKRLKEYLNKIDNRKLDKLVNGLLFVKK